jgi:hypothetical protein
MHGDVAKAVYCHWDGYLEGVGATLVAHYDSVKANKLVSMGDISSLGPEIGEKHSFSRLDTTLSSDEYEKLYGHMTTFYGRDREEENMSWVTFHSLNDLTEFYESSWCEYIYILKDNTWYYSNRTTVPNDAAEGGYESFWSPLAELAPALQREELADEV